MKTPIENSSKHLGPIFVMVVALSIWVAGCAEPTPKSVPDPLLGWTGGETVYEGCALDKTIIDDYRDYIQKLRPEERSAVNDFNIRCYEGGAGQHAVKIEIGLKGTNWSHILIYDKGNRRLKTLKYVSGIMLLETYMKVKLRYFLVLCLNLYGGVSFGHMKTPIKKSSKHLGPIFVMVVAISIWVVGCAEPTQKSVPDPLKGWNGLGSAYVIGCPFGQRVFNDYRNYIQNLSPEERSRVDDSDIRFYDNGGQRAVEVSIPLNGTWWRHVLIYDKESERINVIKYASSKYQS